MKFIKSGEVFFKTDSLILSWVTIVFPMKLIWVCVSPCEGLALKDIVTAFSIPALSAMSGLIART